MKPTILRSLLLLPALFVGAVCLIGGERKAMAVGTDQESRTQADPGRKPVLEDVSLDESGSLHGVVLDEGGRPIEGVSVGLLDFAGRTLSPQCAVVRSDVRGRFAWPNLRGGLYCVVAGGGERWLRVWKADTAPPAAADGVRLVQRKHVVRGQNVDSVQISSQTMLFGAALGTGVAVPLILDSRGGDDPSGS